LHGRARSRRFDVVKAHDPRQRRLTRAGGGDRLDVERLRTDSEASVERLVSALTAIAAGARTSGKKAATQAPPKLPLAGRQAISPREAFFGACEALSLAACVGRVSAEMVVPYPPDIPMLGPGEEITAETVDYLREAAASGILIHGPRDLTLATLQVVAVGLV
jgi:arginine decarboxylase